MEGCSVGILIDLNEPSPVNQTKGKSPVRKNEKDGSKENDNPLTDSIEIERSADRRNSFTLSSPNGFQSRILQDITQESTTPANLKHWPSSPGVQLIEDEVFDFDLAMSPATRSTDVSRNEIDGDDEEVFFGPVGFTEKCLAVAVSETAPLEERIKPMSPLSAAQVAELVKEANLVAYRISTVKPTSPDSDTEKKSSFSSISSKSCSTGNELESPTKVKHQRKGTFTESPNSVDKLPDKVKESIPVIDSNMDFKSARNLAAQKPIRGKENVQNHSKSKLAVPKSSKLPGIKGKGAASKSQTKLFQAGSSEKLNREDVSGTDTDDTCSVSSDVSESSVSQIPNRGNASKSNTTRRSIGLKRPSGQQISSRKSLNANTSIASKKDTTVLRKPVESRLQGPPAERVQPRPQKSQNIPMLSNPQKRGLQLPQKSGIPSMKKPLSKLELIKPGMLQKQTLNVNRNQNTGGTKTRNGPMKVIVPMENTDTADVFTDECNATNQNLETIDIVTPVKPEKKVQPKLLSNNFNTPVRSHSVSSSSPASARRRSFLPTPQKLRTSSISSLPPESSLTRLSVSSQKSRCSSTTSISESPLANNNTSATKLHQPRAVKKSLNAVSKVDSITCNSPSALRKSVHSNAKISKGGEHPKHAKKTSIRMVTSQEAKTAQFRRRSYAMHKENV